MLTAQLELQGLLIKNLSSNNNNRATTSLPMSENKKHSTILKTLLNDNNKIKPEKPNLVEEQASQSDTVEMKEKRRSPSSFLKL